MIYKRIWVRPFEKKGLFSLFNDEDDTSLKNVLLKKRTEFPIDLFNNLLWRPECTMKEFNITVNKTGTCSANQPLINFLQNRMHKILKFSDSQDKICRDLDDSPFGESDLESECTCHTKKKLMEFKPPKTSSHIRIKAKRLDVYEDFDIFADKMTIIMDDNDARQSDIQVMVRDALGRIKISENNVVTQEDIAQIILPRASILSSSKTPSEPGILPSEIDVKKDVDLTLPKGGILSKKLKESDKASEGPESEVKAETNGEDAQQTHLDTKKITTKAKKRYEKLKKLSQLSKAGKITGKETSKMKFKKSSKTADQVKDGDKDDNKDGDKNKNEDDKKKDKRKKIKEKGGQIKEMTKDDAEKGKIKPTDAKEKVGAEKIKRKKKKKPPNE
ncbi:unnamed protein product [Gordionus sp. m RMFG-2023]